ncbi:MAG TPA: Gfo/Idh/MocA family oxidoreductase [Planctomycetota bacterium]|nr:Gfo/Idh/MocA family oxidoreductase [Planctomycetota bacterium]
MADKKVRVGLIGVGGIAQAHMNRFGNIPECEVTAFCDPSEEMRKKAPGRHACMANAKAFENEKDLIKSGLCDAVEINSPHAMHRDQIVASLNAGLHVLTEKPIANSVAEIKDIIKAEKKSGKLCSISYQRHFQGDFRLMRRLVVEGAIGKVIQVCSFLSQDWFESQTGTWRQKKAISGGGQIHDSGSHILDMQLWVSGLSAESVSCLQQNFGREVDINSSVSVMYEGGAIGTITIAGRAPSWCEEFTVFGEKGALFYRNGEVSQQTYSKEGMITAKFDKLREISNPNRNWIDAILGKAELEVRPEIGLRVIQLTEAAWESAAQNGKPVKVKAV